MSQPDMNTVTPVWSGVTPLHHILPQGQRLVLHAGPPFKDASELPIAIRNSVLVGIQYEGWAADKAAAEALLDKGGVCLAPAQDYDVVVPLAGVVTPSMYAIEVSDANQPQRKKYSVLNEGMEWCTRLGIYNDQMVPHLRWLHQDLGPLLADTFSEPIALAPILQASLLNGDDGHARTMYASRLLVDVIVSRGVKDPASQDFLYGALAWALNYWMAVSALLLDSQTHQPDQDAIIKVGGNGKRFGLQLASQPGVWWVTEAPKIHGVVAQEAWQDLPLGVLGDSAVVDFVGLGGQCLDLASLSAQNLQAFLPTDYATRQSQFLMTPLSFLAGRRGLTDFQRVVATDTGPLVLLGMIDGSGEHGRIGGGVATVTAALLQSLQEWQHETTMV